MRKLLSFLGASLVLTAALPASAQQAPDMFKDVPKDHWAYEAVEYLRSVGILIGYPDGYFRGKRTLTRYEFAVALDRALKSAVIKRGGIDTPVTPVVPGQGSQGLKGDTGPPGPPGVTPEELDRLRRLAAEFRDELSALGNNVAAINRRLDDIARRLAAVEEQLARMPKISGNALIGYRSDNAHGNYVDKDGRVNPLGSRQALVHALGLGISAKVPGGADVEARIAAGNYKGYLSNDFGKIAPRPQGLNIGPVGGHSSGSLNSTPASDVYLDLLEVRAPFSGIGRGSALTIGRFAHRMGRLTLWRPDVDSYFSVPWEDDGRYRIDGARLNTNFGSVSFEAFGGKFDSVQGVAGGPINSPLAGTIIDPGGTRIFSFGSKPIGQHNLGQMTVNNIVGVSAGLGFRQLLQGGHIRLSALEMGGTSSFQFNGVHALGADLDLRVADRINLSADWGKTITHTGRSKTVFPHFNNAFNVNLGFGSGPINLTAGYRFIDPHFYAPGYWGRIGNWLNPTNVQGPTVRAVWDMSPAFAIQLGGDYYTAARNRATRGGLGSEDHIGRALVGVRWNLSKSFQTTLDWEGVFWELEGAHSTTGLTPSLTIVDPRGTTRRHPMEQYLTIGTGYNLTSNALIKMMYQVGAYDGKNLLLNAPGVGPKNNFGVFTTQATVRF